MSGENTLLIGLDESNHSRYPEIVVGVGSTIPSDSTERFLSGRNRMDECQLVTFLQHEQRSYAHLEISEGGIRQGEHQLVVAAPILYQKLILGYPDIDSVEILFDGEMQRGQIDGTCRRLYEISKGTKCFSARAYPKSKAGLYRYPLLLLAADSLAHYIYTAYALQNLLKRIGAEERKIPFQSLQ